MNDKIPIAELIMATYNPRKIRPDEFLNLKQSIQQFGMVQPVTVNKDKTVIAGHQRIAACQELGMTEVPCFIIDVDKETERVLNIALNRIGGEFDEDKLREILKQLSMEQLQLTGMSDRDLAEILGQEPEPEDKDEEMDKAPRTAVTTPLGTIYKMGRHRLMYGDSTNPDHIKALMAGQEAKMVFSDPPYNVNYKGEGENTDEGIENDDMTEADFALFCDKFMQRYQESIATGAPVYFCSGWSSYPAFKKALEDHGFKFSGVIIWVKESASMGWNDYRYRHEWIMKGEKGTKKKGVPILYGWKRGKHYFRDTRDETDVWEVPRKASGKYFHPTEKPVWLPMKAIQNSTRPGEIVLDLFGGSGSTMIGADLTNRVCYTCELDPKFVDVIIRRWENLHPRESVEIIEP